LLSFGHQLFQGCLCKSMVDSCCKMLAKRWQSGSMTATADDTSLRRMHQSAVLFTCDIGSPPSTADHPPTGLHCIVAGGRGGVSALPAHRWMLFHHQASCTNVNPSSPETEVLPQRRLIRGSSWVSNFGCFFLTSKEGIELYANPLVCKYILYVNFQVK